MTEMKQCSKCKEVKAGTEFYKNSRDGLASECKTCTRDTRRKLHRVNPDARLKNSLYGYNLSVDGYKELLASQHSVCAICGKKPGKIRLAIDHDHSCCPKGRSCGNCIRGLLCRNCNYKMLGQICEEGRLGTVHA